MTLHDENEFKIKGYSNAIFNLERYNEPISTTSVVDLEKIQGVGKSTAKAIDEINKTGELEALELLKKETPEGVMEMLRIKGLGTKKIKVLWKQLDITNTTALLKIADNGELAKVKGFGDKTAQNIKEILSFLEENKGKLHYSDAERISKELIQELMRQFPNDLIEISGEVRRKLDVINEIKFVIGTESKLAITTHLASLSNLNHEAAQSSPKAWRGSLAENGTPIVFQFCKKSEFYNSLIKSTGSAMHLSQEIKDGLTLNDILRDYELEGEEQAYEIAKTPYIAPELREGDFEWQAANENRLPVLVEMDDLQGILHNHSTWSDGKHSLQEMAEKCRDLGYKYLGISDHSKSAFFYANGLFEERIEKQHVEIEELNQSMSPFKIFKGIESDILPDGRLDYDDEVLSTFDFIVSSIHSGLSMDIEKATNRLLTAIANPFTTMLGHPTGRLLLKRKGYPIDHKRIIDACAEYGVIIEINANPWRLDLDWRWVNYALGQGVRLSINPDAHDKERYGDMYYGLCVGRKGGLTKEMTFNALSVTEVESHFLKRKERAFSKLK